MRPRPGIGISDGDRVPGLNQQVAQLPVQAVAAFDVPEFVPDHEAQFVGGHGFDQGRVQHQAGAAVSHGVSIHDGAVGDVQIGNRTREDFRAAHQQFVERPETARPGANHLLVVLNVNQLFGEVLLKVGQQRRGAGNLFQRCQSLFVAGVSERFVGDFRQQDLAGRKDSGILDFFCAWRHGRIIASAHATKDLCSPTAS